MKNQILNNIFKIQNVTLPTSFEQNAKTFASELLTFNKIHNITGAKDIKSVYENILDSVYPLQFLEKMPISSIDIGSGAGFPAIPLAFALPQCRFTLYEPIAKKSAFLHMIKSKTELSNVEIKTKRIEHDAPKSTDLITSRAVGNAELLIRLAKGFYVKNSVMILYKGQRAKEEVFGLKNTQIFERGKRAYIVIRDIENVF